MKLICILTMFFIIWLSNYNVYVLFLLPFILLLLKPHNNKLILSQKAKDNIDENYIIKQIQYNLPIMYSFKDFKILNKYKFEKKPIYKVRCLTENECIYTTNLSKYIDRVKKFFDVTFVLITNAKYINHFNDVFDIVLDVSQIDYNTLSVLNSFDINYHPSIQNKVLATNLDLFGENSFDFKINEQSLIYYLFEGECYRYFDFRNNSVYLEFDKINSKYMRLQFMIKEGLYFVEKNTQYLYLRDLYGKEDFYIYTNFKYKGSNVVKNDLLFLITNGYFYITTKPIKTNINNIKEEIVNLYTNASKITILMPEYEIFNEYLPNKIKELYFIYGTKYLFEYKNFVYGYKMLPIETSKMRYLNLSNSNLSCYYNYIRYTIFGIYILQNGIKFLPTIKSSFSVNIEHNCKQYSFVLNHFGEEYAIINNIRYYNLNYISFKNIERYQIQFYF